MLWDLFQQYQIGQLDDKIDRVQNGASKDPFARQSTHDLEERVERLALISYALFELLQEATGVTEEKLRAKVVEIDLRDGKGDGRATPQPSKCPKCEATISPKFGRCLFCGYRPDSGGPLV
jgi:hypothetical protein